MCGRREIGEKEVMGTRRGEEKRDKGGGRMDDMGERGRGEVRRGKKEGKRGEKGQGLWEYEGIRTRVEGGAWRLAMIKQV